MPQRRRGLPAGPDRRAQRPSSRSRSQSIARPASSNRREPSRARAKHERYELLCGCDRPAPQPTCPTPGRRVDASRRGRPRWRSTPTARVTPSARRGCWSPTTRCRSSTCSISTCSRRGSPTRRARAAVHRRADARGRRSRRGCRRRSTTAARAIRLRDRRHRRLGAGARGRRRCSASTPARGGDRIASRFRLGAEQCRRSAIAIVTLALDRGRREPSSGWIAACCINECTSDTQRPPTRLRGVFLSVGASDGTVRFVDIHDMELNASRGQLSDDERRHVPRVPGTDATDARCSCGTSRGWRDFADATPIASAERRRVRDRAALRRRGSAVQRAQPTAPQPRRARARLHRRALDAACRPSRPPTSSPADDRRQTTPTPARRHRREACDG